MGACRPFSLVVLSSRSGDTEVAPPAPAHAVDISSGGSGSVPTESQEFRHRGLRPAGRFRRMPHVSRSGFTLIELLTSMTLLVIIVMMMAQVFNDATATWTSSTRRINAAAEARAVVGMLSRELSMAIADDIVTFRISGNGSPPHFGLYSYDFPNSEVCFLALVRQSDSSYRRAAYQYVYFVALMKDESGSDIPHRYRLVRTRRTRTVFDDRTNRERSGYEHDQWWTFHPGVDSVTETTLIETVVENIAAFEVDVYSAHVGDYVAPNAFVSDEHDSRLPVWADIYLEILDETDAERVAALWPVDRNEATQYLVRNARRYSSRVYFMNRDR